MAEMNMLIDMPRRSHFRHLLGPANLSIRKATEIFPTAILIIHKERETVLSLMMSGSSGFGIKYRCLA